ncbi:MAG: hypothetical protein WD689_02785 [Gaiellaceae bacterium]
MTTKKTPPSAAAILERAFSLTNEAMFTVALQIRRLGSEEPEDKDFVMRWWADLQFLIVALRRLRRAAELAARVDDPSASVRKAIALFDAELPALRVMRNVGEHIDEYAVDHPRRHHEEIDRRQLQVGSWDGRVYRWLQDQSGEQLELDADRAKTAAEQLFEEVRSLYRVGVRSCGHGV